MKALALVISVLLLGVNHPSSAMKILKAFKRNRYFWNGKLNHYHELEPCPPTYWSLEIYDEEIQQNVNEYILHVVNRTADSNVSRSIENHHVPLNISCQNQTDCIWKDTNTKATYFNWNSFDGHGNVYSFQASTENNANKWTMTDKLENMTFAKLCMNSMLTLSSIVTEKETSAVNAENTPEPSRTHAEDFDKTLLLVVMISTAGPTILGVFLYARKKSKQRRDDTSATLSQTTPGSSPNECSVSIKSPRAAESIYCKCDPLESEYISWSLNLSMRNKNLVQFSIDDCATYLPMRAARLKIQTI